MRKLKDLHARALTALLCTLAMGFLAACDDSPLDVQGIEESDLVASYEAVELEVTQGTAAPTDVLARGGSLSLILHQTGGASGTLFAPGLGPGGADIDESFTGIWSFNDLMDEVELAIDSELFVEEFVLDVAENPLADDEVQIDGEADFGGYTVTISLREAV